MVRKNYMITASQEKLLKEEAKKQEVSISEILRKAIDSYFASRK
jgi:hypothetical protein